jgi:hypothetical protein
MYTNCFVKLCDTKLTDGDSQASIERRGSMGRWFYNSDGDPIAFVMGSSVFSRRGEFVGSLTSDNHVWNGDYIGELFADDRLIFNANTLHGRRPMPGLPPLPGHIGEPGFRGPVTIPLGYHDVDLK